jgi:hypothetical protein
MEHDLPRVKIRSGVSKDITAGEQKQALGRGFGMQKEVEI